MTKITLLDGGMGQEIVQRAGDPLTPLWSTNSMIDHPGIVAAVHSDYFKAGATIATTNTYCVHRDRLSGAGLEDRFESLLEQAMSEAIEAKASNGEGRIAGSIGPLAASYRPDLCPPVEVAANLFKEVATHLASNSDILLCETVASIQHAEGVLTGVQSFDLPVWLSVTVSDDNGKLLRSGEAVSDLAKTVEEFAPEAVLVNCSVPEVMEDALNVISGFERPYGAYANGFNRINEAFLEDRPTVGVLEVRQDLTPEVYADFALHWIGMGATIIGGCCETGPAHIAEIVKRLTSAGLEIA